MTDPQAGPADPLTSLAAAAASLHEIHVELLRVGFDPVDALRLTTAVLVEPLRAQLAPCPHCGRPPGG